MTVDRETAAILIARFIAEHGVTHCPPAIATITQGVIPDPETRAAHAARGLYPLGDAWRKHHPGWMAMADRSHTKRRLQRRQ
jgi:hypothetical protein